MAKLNLRDISVMYGAVSFTSVMSASVLGYLWEHMGGNTDYVLAIGGALLVVNIPSTLVGLETLRKKLGERQQNTVRAIGGHQNRRAIPFGANGKQSHIFMSILPWMKPQPEMDSQPEFDLPTIFTSTIDGNDYSVTLPEIETFVRTAWRKQRIGEAGLSRPYWTRRHQPRLRPLEYYTRLNILLSCSGLVLDRSQRRSGRLSVPPALAIKALQSQFSLV